MLFNCFTNSSFAFFSSLRLFVSLISEIDTGLPPKFAASFKVNLSAPIISPVFSLIRLASIDAFTELGRSSLSKIYISKDAVDDPPTSPKPLIIDILSAENPRFLLIYSIKFLSSFCMYLSSNSFPASIAFFSTMLIIESVIFSLVPIGIFKSTVKISLSTTGKKSTGMIPPITELTVRYNAATNPDRLANRF